MEHNSESARVDAKNDKPASGRLDQVSITLHWLTVFLILVQFTSAWQREAVDLNTSFAVALLTTHRTWGALIWIVSLVRLVWRHNFAYLPPFPDSMPKLQQTLSESQ
jgi:cytochrome b561